MAIRNAEVVDLDAYRERRASVARSRDESILSSMLWLLPLAPFFMPIALFACWPTWVFAPQAVPGRPEGGANEFWNQLDGQNNRLDSHDDATDTFH